MAEFGSGGALFVQQKKSNSNSPDWGGDLEIKADELDYILREAKQGNPVKLRLAGWRKQNRDGSIRINLALSIPREQQQSPGGYKQGRGSYNQGEGSGRYRDDPCYSNRSREENRYAPQQRQDRHQERLRFDQRRELRDDLNDDLPF